MSAIGRGVADYLKRVWEYRYFWFSLARADLQRRYRRSVLGLGWSLLQPLAMAAVLCLVYRNLFKMDFREFGLFLLSGFAVWNFFTGVMLQGCGCFLNAESYIRQEPAPLVIYPLRIVLTLGFHSLIALVLPLVLGWFLLGGVSVTALLSLVPSIALLFLFGWSMATLAAYAHVYFADTQHLTEIGLQALMFLTPVLYPPRVLAEHGMGWLLRVNPLAVLLDLLRTPIMQGQAPSWDAYALAAAFVAVPVVLAGLVTARLEREVIFAM